MFVPIRNFRLRCQNKSCKWIEGQGKAWEGLNGRRTEDLHIERTVRCKAAHPIDHSAGKC